MERILAAQSRNPASALTSTLCWEILLLAYLWLIPYFSLQRETPELNSPTNKKIALVHCVERCPGNERLLWKSHKSSVSQWPMRDYWACHVCKTKISLTHFGCLWTRTQVWKLRSCSPSFLWCMSFLVFSYIHSKLNCRLIFWSWCSGAARLPHQNISALFDCWFLSLRSPTLPGCNHKH